MVHFSFLLPFVSENILEHKILLFQGEKLKLAIDLVNCEVTVLLVLTSCICCQFSFSESLKNYSCKATKAKIKREQLQDRELLESDQNSLSNRATTATAGGIPDTAAGEFLAGTEEGEPTLTSWYQKVMRQNSLNSNSIRVKQETCVLKSFIPGAPSSPIQLSKSSSPGLTIQNSPSVHSSSGHSSQGSQNSQQCIIQKLLQEMMSNSGANGSHSSNGGEEVFSGVNTTSTVGGSPRMPRRPSLVRRGNISAVASPANVLVGRNKSFKAASSSKSSGTSGNKTIVKREPDLPLPVASHGLYESAAE